MTEPQNPSPLTHSPALEITPQPLLPPKRKRSLPGMPDPDAEVIALSPKTLLATNRFVCEICNKGFQRDQNLQLHRRGHNLPWKLRQRGSTEPRKKAYVCPEPSCVHHNPARALGDLTGIKKHFCRKHGEKKWQCERCSKKYAVHSDWKAHMKTCGSREYRCDCGTLFSRRDSFITHRAFCDVLAQESARAQAQAQGQGGSNSKVVEASSPPTPPLTPSASVVPPTLSIQSSEIPENPSTKLSPTSPNATACFVTSSSSTPSNSTTCTTVFASVLAPSPTTPSTPQSPSNSTSSFTNLISNLARSQNPNTIMRESTSLSLSTPLYLSNNDPLHYTASPQPALSATAHSRRQRKWVLQMHPFFVA
ncbi:Protein indeterminate-domain 2 [Glycine soja]|uniref:Protein indeterminate-domain 2 n=1 Tax=Glycine soja TaxID=3848 RepID=A0A445KUY4_GLYSO|nr:Protein indeterminate-domain 2 [Glycine soja]